MRKKRKLTTTKKETHEMGIWGHPHELKVGGRLKTHHQQVSGRKEVNIHRVRRSPPRELLN